VSVFSEMDAIREQALSSATNTIDEQCTAGTVTRASIRDAIDRELVSVIMGTANIVARQS